MQDIEQNLLRIILPVLISAQIQLSAVRSDRSVQGKQAFPGHTLPPFGYFLPPEASYYPACVPHLLHPGLIGAGYLYPGQVQTQQRFDGRWATWPPVITSAIIDPPPGLEVQNVRIDEASQPGPSTPVKGSPKVISREQATASSGSRRVGVSGKTRKAEKKTVSLYNIIKPPVAAVPPIASSADVEAAESWTYMKRYEDILARARQDLFRNKSTNKRVLFTDKKRWEDLIRTSEVEVDVGLDYETLLSILTKLDKERAQQRQEARNPTKLVPTML